MRMHMQWILVSERTEIGDYVESEPLIFLADGEDGVVYRHPLRGEDWEAKVVKICPNAGFGVFHALVMFCAVPAIDEEDGGGYISSEKWEKYHPAE